MHTDEVYSTFIIVDICKLYHFFECTCTAFISTISLLDNTRGRNGTQINIDIDKRDSPKLILKEWCAYFSSNW